MPSAVSRVPLAGAVALTGGAARSAGVVCGRAVVAESVLKRNGYQETEFQYSVQLPTPNSQKARVRLTSLAVGLANKRRNDPYHFDCLDDDRIVFGGDEPAIATGPRVPRNYTS